jgi:hypothetical protein
MSCVRTTSAMITRDAKVQKSLGSKNSRLRKCTAEVAVIDEGPKAVGPGLVVVGPPSLRRRMEWNTARSVGAQA